MHEALIISIPPDIFLIITAAQCGMMQAARSASNVNLRYLFHKNQLIFYLHNSRYFRNQPSDPQPSVQGAGRKPIVSETLVGGLHHQHVRI
jgi:hypothetical protein